MTTTSTSTERLVRMDREVEELKQACVDAAVQLTESPEVDDSYEERWRSIGRRLNGLRTELQPADYDKAQVVEFYGTLLDIRDLMDEERSLDTLDQLVLAVERVRHVVRDALDEHVDGVADDVGVVIDELLQRLDGVKREDVSDLIGVDRRTLARWKKQSTSPTRRLATVARLVAILRHNWTPEGIVAWFHRPRRDLDGRTPLALLQDDQHDDEALLAAARAGRSQYAT